MGWICSYKLVSSGNSEKDWSSKTTFCASVPRRISKERMASTWRQFLAVKLLFSTLSSLHHSVFSSGDGQQRQSEELRPTFLSLTTFLAPTPSWGHEMKSTCSISRVWCPYQLHSVVRLGHTRPNPCFPSFKPSVHSSMNSHLVPVRKKTPAACPGGWKQPQEQLGTLHFRVA